MTNLQCPKKFQAPMINETLNFILSGACTHPFASVILSGACTHAQRRISSSSNVRFTNSTPTAVEILRRAEYGCAQDDNDAYTASVIGLWNFFGHCVIGHWSFASSQPSSSCPPAPPPLPLKWP